MDTIRAFIAIDPPPALQQELGALQQALKLGRAVRWTRAEQIHLTLKFLGEIPAQSAAELGAALRRGCETLAPFTLHIDGLGCFPNPKKPRIIWAGLAGDLDALRELARRVDYESITISGHSEEREFVPHLTLGRVKDVPFREMQRVGQALRSVEQALPLPGTSWRVEHLALMRSELTPKGAIHTELTRIELKGS